MHDRSRETRARSSLMRLAALALARRGWRLPRPAAPGAPAPRPEGEDHAAMRSSRRATRSSAGRRLPERDRHQVWCGSAGHGRRAAREGGADVRRRGSSAQTASTTASRSRCSPNDARSTSRSARHRGPDHGCDRVAHHTRGVARGYGPAIGRAVKRAATRCSRRFEWPRVVRCAGRERNQARTDDGP